MDYLAQILSNPLVTIDGNVLSSRYVSDIRDSYVSKFGYAIPNEKALQEIALYGPIVEYGAGTGYWAYRLRKIGVEVIPFDVKPPNEGNNQYKFRYQWVDDINYPQLVANFAYTHSLMLCWPCYGKKWATDVVQEYRVSGGKYFIYIGEPKGGCTGTDGLFNEIKKYWSICTIVNIPTWYWLHDKLIIYSRMGA
jgi:hypothetical protein